MEPLTFASSQKSSSPRLNMSSQSVASRERRERLTCRSMCPLFTSGQSTKDVSNDCELSPTQHCWVVLWRTSELSGRRFTASSPCRSNVVPWLLQGEDAVNLRPDSSLV